MQLKSILNELKKYSWVVTIILSLAAFGFSAYNLKLTNQKLSSAPSYSGLGTQVAGSTVDIAKFTSELTGKEPVLGDKSAKLTIYEFADFQCPFCKKFFDQNLTEIKSKYIDTGKVKFIFINLAFLGQESIDAGQAALCASDQGQFWAYHDQLYKNQKGENLGNFSTEKLSSLARLVNLNLTDFNQCVSSHKYEKMVNDEVALARKYGITGTPTFFIRDRILKGVIPLVSFKQTLDELLK
jgi:protein-disulfide isomerase